MKAFIKIVLVLCFAFYVIDFNASAQELVNEKKLIQWGHDVPTPQYMLKNIREMEQMPFDGILIKLPVSSPGDEHLAKSIFIKSRINYDMVKDHIETLKQVKFEKFTDNFNRVQISPFSYDWFDDLSVPIHNIKIAARVAKEAGLKGFFFDVEMYNYINAWTYPYMKHANTKSWGDYCRQVERGGAEIMRAINEIYPDITIIFTYGYYVNLKEIEEDTELELSEYGLMPFFFNGMIKAAAAETTLIDGYARSKGYTTEEQFLKGYNIAINKGRVFCSYKNKFGTHWRTAFTIMLDYRGKGRSWDPDDWSKNYRTPGELKRDLAYALQTSDKYVWLYNERAVFWPNSTFERKPRNIPPQYIEAIRRGREAGSQFYDKSKRQHLKIVHTSKTDESVFNPVWKEHEPVQSLSGTWLFRTDKDMIGYRNQWFKDTGSDSGWKPIKVPEFWEPQGYAGYDGVAWYKTTFKVPEKYRGHKLKIAFGAVFEASRVYVNGELAGEHIFGSRRGWNKMFTIDINKQVDFEGDNLLVVQVINILGPGGIWKDIMLTAAKRQ